MYVHVLCEWYVCVCGTCAHAYVCVYVCSVVWCACVVCVYVCAWVSICVCGTHTSWLLQVEKPSWLSPNRLSKPSILHGSFWVTSVPYLETDSLTLLINASVTATKWAWYKMQWKCCKIFRFCTKHSNFSSKLHAMTTLVWQHQSQRVVTLALQSCK